MPATSSLSWLDHSDYERRKAIEVIKLFEERGTVDELGVGTVRDAISDLLFPGTSVLQPRARYFLIIPWIYLHLEARRVPSAEVAAKARALETDLIDQILASNDSQGAIGRIARKKLKLLPSFMYWAGLGAFGLRQYPGGRDEYHRWLDRYYAVKKGVIRTEDGERVTDAFKPAWRPGLPKPPQGFLKGPLSLSLTVEEARYLQERILTTCNGTLMAHLVDRCRPAPDSDFAWFHPDFGSFSERHQQQLEHGRNLSELVFGAVLIYNLHLAEKFAKRDDWIQGYRSAYMTWCGEVAERRDRYTAWSRNDFWATVFKVNPRITSVTRGFLDTWFDLALAPNPERLPELRQVRQLIADRELKLKGKLARLHNEMALKNWGGASGVGRLSYRWNPQVRQITADIQNGLRSNA
jgi:hypothetical protein